MNGYVFIFALIVFCAAIASIATASIGIQCYNKCDSPDMNKEMPNNKTFLVISLILSIILLFMSFSAFYAAWITPSLPFGKFLNMANGQMPMGMGMGGMGMMPNLSSLMM
jgi:CHASE2 domain-containing sensor protein